LETLSQLMQFSFDSELFFIPFAPWTVSDAPRFAHRGLLIDSSRHFEPVPTIMGVIDSMTYAKLNALHV
jgi:hexosaminidase